MPHPTDPSLQTYSPPPSNLRPLCHPLVDEVVRDVDGYYLKHLELGSERAKKKFVAAGLSRVSCLYFPRLEMIAYVMSARFSRSSFSWMVNPFLDMDLQIAN